MSLSHDSQIINPELNLAEQISNDKCPLQYDLIAQAEKQQQMTVPTSSSPI